MRQQSFWGNALTHVAMFALVLVVSCGAPPRDRPPPDANPGDDASPACDPKADDDGDCIPNGVEGCQLSPPSDHDGDGSPDYVDGDADGDGLIDELEAGATCDEPRDTDGDGTPDFQDTDSDNDGVDDQFEDRDGNGVIGTCTTQCTTSAHCPPSAYCSVAMDGVGHGVCVSLACLDGETDPHSQDTDGDGISDSLEGTAICNPTTPTNPFGLKPIKYVDSLQTAYVMSNWRLALDTKAVETVPAIASPAPLHAGYGFDMIAANAQVAGFLASRPAGASSAVAEIGALTINLENAAFINGVTVRASGNNTTSLDGFETVLGASLELTTSSPLTVTEVREIVTAAALGRPPTDVTFPSPGWTTTPDTRFVVSVQAIRRAEALQTLFVGGVARAVHADDPTRTTAFHLNDMSNGTGVAVSGNGEELECEQFVISRQAKADIIWIVDESGSTSDDRQRIVDNASVFFNKAVNAGLDFRVAVTDMDNAKNGIFATRQSGGTGDRWLLPTEQAQFEANILDPSGPDTADGGTEHGLTQMRATLMRHLPRDNTDPQKIREDAAVVIIFVTDEKAEEVEDAGILGEGNLEPNPTQQAAIDALLAPYLAELQANNVQVHLIAEPLPFSSVCSGGGAEHAYGYYELVNATGGQLGSICQLDLSATIDALIEDIIGGASPLTLKKVPISTSVSVSREATPMSRSRVNGFDYRGASNAITFFNQFFSPAMPAEIVVSYRRWAQQGPIE